MRQYNNIIAGIILLVALMAVSPFNVVTRQNVVLVDKGYGQRFLVEGFYLLI